MERGIDMQSGALIFLILLPLAASVPILFGRNDRLTRMLALMVTTVEFGITLLLFYMLSRPGSASGPWLMYVDMSWIPRYGIRFSLGMDGISMLMVTLSALLFMLSVLVSWRAVTERVALFHFTLLVMEAGVMGVFLATDLFLFYLFWEVMLIPMFFLIGVWGHGRKVYSAVKFFIYTVSGSLLMLLAIIGLYVIHGRQTGSYTFALESLSATTLDPTLAAWMFGAFMLAFAVKVPLFPLHSWLPDAHTDAPTAGSVVLAGLLLKTGAYGMIRFAFPLFPQAAAAFLPLLFAVGIIGVFYAALIAFVQTDIKRLVAYSSISHLGLVALGIAAWNDVSLAGSTLQMVNHGVTTGALFIMVGMLDERAHTRDIAAFGGLWSKAPVFSAFFLLFILSSLGLPGLNNFAGELLILTGLFRGHPILAAAAFAGIVATLIYLLRLAQKLLFGPVGSAQEFTDLSARELAIVIPLAALVIVIGLYPKLLLAPLDAPIKGLVRMYSITAYSGGGVP
jgi:NADH-quinone oxidoreductase subunit M